MKDKGGINIYNACSYLNNHISKLYQTFNKSKQKKEISKAIRAEEGTKRDALEAKYNYLEHGVSVIIGTYKGEDKIDRCLESLKNQNLDHRLFEVIFIINGQRGNTDQIIHNAFAEIASINYSILYLENPGIAAARNVGINAAKMKYTCFLDDDDFFSANFLKEMLASCENSSVVFSQIVDIDENGMLDTRNSINSELLQYRRLAATDMHKIVRGISMNGGKMFPTMLVKDHKFDERLQNGEDIVFFTQLFTSWDFVFKILPARKKVIYYRLKRNNSVSRQQLSYKFHITDRIAVLKRLEDLLKKAEYPHRISFIKLRIMAQVGFMRNYLKKHETMKEQVYADIIKAKLINFPFQMFNDNKAKTLVVSYCFPPYVDTSGTVVSKRIRTKGALVDVIYNKMDTRRAINHNLSLMANEFIDKKFGLDTPTTFSDWAGMEQFVDEGLSIIKSQVKKKGHYKKLYSRAMWPASHFLAYAYKTKHRKVKWTAEFSDPVIYNIHGQERKGSITNGAFLEDIKKELSKVKAPMPESDNIFFWCEYLSYVFADVILFTNENQKNYMLKRFPIQEIKPLVLQKCIVSHHPVLPEMFYYIQESNYPINPDFVNLAYFGAFYQTRKLNELIDALKMLDQEEAEKIKIHVFTENADLFKNEMKGTQLESVFQIKPYADYFEFLNLTKKFDCLIVNDAATKGVKEFNPYLPSKMSDYIGSGSSIWGIAEEGSVLSSHGLTYKSPLGDAEAAKNVLRTLIRNKSIN